jgi:hypothetical protein
MVGTSEAHAAIDAGLPLYRQHPGYIQGSSPEAQFWRTRIGPVMRLQKIYISYCLRYEVDRLRIDIGVESTTCDGCPCDSHPGRHQAGPVRQRKNRVKCINGEPIGVFTIPRA